MLNTYPPKTFVPFNLLSLAGFIRRDSSMICKALTTCYRIKSKQNTGFKMSTVANNYQQQAVDFLTATDTTFTATYRTHDFYFSDDKEKRDIYVCVLKNKSHRYRFLFGQSLNDSTCGNNPPTAYDILACLTKYDPYSFEDFCSNYGYDEDSRKAYKTFKAAMKEWKNLELLFTPEQIEELAEIN